HPREDERIVLRDHHSNSVRGDALRGSCDARHESPNAWCVTNHWRPSEAILPPRSGSNNEPRTVLGWPWPQDRPSGISLGPRGDARSDRRGRAASPPEFTSRKRQTSAIRNNTREATVPHKHLIVQKGSSSQEVSMTAPRRRSGVIAAATVALMSSASMSALAQAPDPTRTIPGNGSIFIDGRTFTVTPGAPKGDVSAQIRNLGARELGPGAIIFRSDDKLYMVDAAPLLQRSAAAYDPAIERQRPYGLRDSDIE